MCGHDHHLHHASISQTVSLSCIDILESKANLILKTLTGGFVRANLIVNLTGNC